MDRHLKTIVHVTLTAIYCEGVFYDPVRSAFSAFIHKFD
jgi:hypothetical protein